MARKRYYRRRRRLRWSKQIKNITNAEFNAPANAEFTRSYDLIENPPESQNDVPTPK